MRISSANPLQWYAVDALSFNHTKFAGVIQACFMQLFNITDNIGTQFEDISDVEAYDLLVRDWETDEILNAVPFERPDGTVNIYENFFNPLEDWDGRIVYCQIVNHADVDIVFAYTDPISISTDHPETELIKYGNAGNYAGLDYTNGELFELRVWAKFFQQKLPQETESEKKTNGAVVMLSNSMRRHARWRRRSA